MTGIAAYLQQLNGWKRQSVALICGAATSFALTPFYLTPISFLTFPILVILLDGIAKTSLRKKRLQLAALTCWSFGFGYFVCGLWWLSHAMLVDPIAFAWAIPFAVFGLPAYLALYWAFAGIIAMLLWRAGPSRFFALAFALGVGEYLRGTLLTGFPWGAIGYTAMPFPLLMQSAAVVGLYGMNALAVLIYCVPVVFLTGERKAFALAMAIMLLCAQVGFGLYRMSNIPQIADYNQVQRWVRLVQPSIEQSEKLDSQVRMAMFDAHLKLSEAPNRAGSAEPEMVIWPETSVPYILDYVPAAKMRIASTLKPQQFAIVGAVRSDGGPEDEEKHYFNTIEVIDGNGQILDASDKVHLVPFGEYLPYQSLFDKIGLRGIADTVGGYTAGEGRKTVTLPNGFVYLPLICYEVIFPYGLDYQGPAPDAILNVTNDAWFGVTPGPFQHFDQARLRAVELGIPLIRAANNGISAVVDPYGRIVASLGQNKVGFLDVPIPPAIVPIWYKGPNFFHAFVIIAVILIFSIILGRSNPRRSIDN